MKILNNFNLKFFLNEFSNNLLNDDIYKIKDIIIFLLLEKKIFFLQSTIFLNFLQKNFILKIKNINLKIYLKLLINHFKYKIINKSLLKIYDEMFLLFLSLLNKNEAKVILFKSSKILNKDKNILIKDILKKYSIKPFLIITKIDTSLYSGFQIYSEIKRIESSYQRIFIDLFEAFEKNIWRKDE